MTEQIRGRRIENIWRRAKNILLDLSGELTVRVHLRMTGHIYVVSDLASMPPATTFALALRDGRAVVLDDPRTLGRVTIHPAGSISSLLGDLGPEPLEAAFTAEVLRDAAFRVRQPVKLWLLDQRRVAGLGNIWTAEVLHRAKIHPLTPAGTLRAGRLVRLHQAIRTVLQEAIDRALAAVKQPSDFPEADLLGCHVYGREGEPCHTCGRSIRRITQAGRSTYYCPGCQRS